jgi:hypothetical protein
MLPFRYTLEGWIRSTKQTHELWVTNLGVEKRSSWTQPLRDDQMAMGA